MLRRIRRVVLWLLIGFVVSWLIAWALAMGGDRLTSRARASAGARHATQKPVAIALIEQRRTEMKDPWLLRPDDTPWSSWEYRRVGSLLRHWTVLPFTHPDPPPDVVDESLLGPNINLYWAIKLGPPYNWGALSDVKTGESIIRTGYPRYGDDRAWGLPFLCLSSYSQRPTTERDLTYRVHDALVIRRPAFPKLPVVLPLRPLWRGLAANTVFFAIAIPVALAAIRTPRTLRRFRRGRCPRCAYDLAHDYRAGCPECGWRRERSTPKPA